jgi:hypothetical protein
MKRLASSLAFLLLFTFQAASLPAQMLDDTQKGMYAFEHQLIPQWVFHSDGKFFQAMLAGRIEPLQRAATEIVGPDFAAALKVTTIQPGKAVLITFAPPPEMPLCYCAIVAKTDDGYAYYTLEKTINLENKEDAPKTMSCAWTADGTHQNFGPRGYDSPETFVKEFLSRAGKAAPATGVPNPE